MLENKSKILVLSVVSIIMIALAPTGFSSERIDDNFSSDLLTTNNFVKVEPKYLKDFGGNLLKSNYDGDILVSDKTGNESHPSIAVSSNKVIVSYEYEDEGNESVFIKKSSDFGYTWQNDISYFENATSPSFTKLKYSGDFYGTFLSLENTSHIYEVFGSGAATRWSYYDIENSSGDYIGTFSGFETPDIIPYADSTVSWFIGTIGNADFIEKYDEYDCTDSPIFICKDKAAADPENSRTIIFFPEVTGCNNISLALGENEDEGTTIYGVCEIINGSKNEILFFQGDYNLWTDDDTSDQPLIKQMLSFSENISHPQIAVKDNHIYISFETESNEIKLFHSSEYGEEGAWETHSITDKTSPSDSLLYVKSNSLMCTFFQSDNLYKTETENHGANWSEPEKINTNDNSVVGGYKNVGIGDSDRIIWTDNRGINNTDLYMHLSYQPSVDLNILNMSLKKDRPFLPTFNYLSVTVRNDGNVPTTKDIPVNISYETEDGDTVYIKYPFVISERLSPGESVNRKRPMFRFSFPDYFLAFSDFAGIKNITARIDPENTLDDSNLDNNVKTMDVDYEDIFPKVGQNEDLKIIVQIISLLFSLIFG